MNPQHPRLFTVVALACGATGHRAFLIGQQVADRYSNAFPSEENDFAIVAMTRELVAEFDVAEYVAQTVVLDA